MFEIFLLYIITRLDALKSVAEFFMVGGTIFMVLSGIAVLACEVDGAKHLKLFREKCLGYVKYVILSYVIVIITPTQEDVKFIIAGTGLIEMAKSDTAKNIANKSVNIVEKYLDKIEKQVEEPKK